MGFHATNSDLPRRKRNAVDQAVVDILDILRGLPSPRSAAAAIAVVRANMFIQGGATSSADVSRMMNDDDTAALEIWESIQLFSH